MTCRTCGHAKDEHYVYILNGRNQTRCKSCDPFRFLQGNVAVANDSYAAAMNRAADHEFSPEPEEN